MDCSKRYIDSDEDISDQNDTGEVARMCQSYSSNRKHFKQSTKLSNKVSNHGNFKAKLSSRPKKDLYMLSEDIFVIFCEYLNNDDQLNFFLTSKRIMSIVRNSRPILRKFNLTVNKHSLPKLTEHHEMLRIPFKYIELDLENNSKLGDIKNFFINFKSSVENLIIKNGKFKNFFEFFAIFGNMPNIQSISLENCSIDSLMGEVLPKMTTLRNISFNKCNDNVFKVLINQETISKIVVKNNDWTWNGFPHEIFNEIVKNAKSNIKEMVLEGAGTGSFFDSDEFPFKIPKLDTTMITFHWYVGIKTERTTFLKSQLGFLKDLTIHQLPNDFDGGRVLKFIFTSMNLQNFHYGKTALILNGKKQQVRRIEVTEIQVQSLFELVRQFPSITSICLNLSATDIASDEIEKVINPPTDLFKNILEFEIVDNSKYRGIFGVFLGLLKKLTNVKRLSFKTPDRNINVLLEECLPYMNQLTEIYLTSTANRSRERFLIIKKFAPLVNKITVAPQYLEEAKTIFGPLVNVCNCMDNTEQQEKPTTLKGFQ